MLYIRGDGIGLTKPAKLFATTLQLYGSQAVYFEVSTPGDMFPIYHMHGAVFGAGLDRDVAQHDEYCF
ncbi:hypothetical protein OXX79_012588 [Metschnikowia pulcherrima]